MAIEMKSKEKYRMGKNYKNCKSSSGNAGKAKHNKGSGKKTTPPPRHPTLVVDGRTGHKVFVPPA